MSVFVHAQMRIYMNKGEAMNALARAIFFRKQGELRERTMQHALQSGNSMYLLRIVQEKLRNQKIILPGITTIE